MAYDTNTLTNEHTDKLILHELQQRERWQRLHMQWDSRRERQRLARRHSILTLVSNVASVAALVVVGFIIQGVAAGPDVASLQGNVAPAVIHHVDSSSQNAACPTDTVNNVE